MNLDDVSFIKQNDPQDMLGQIDSLPEQLASAWTLGLSLPLPEWTEPKQIVIAGMGGSAIGADLLATYALLSCPVPIFIHRDYGLPAFATGAETLVIASSHSGNTEETLDAFEAARKRQCRILAICTGGELKRRAEETALPVWVFEHPGQPRAAVGFSFGLLLACFARLALIPDPEKDLRDALAAMRSQQERLQVDVPVSQNPAKRLAGQLAGRWVNVYAAGLLAPLARRWKDQINELAKAGAGFEFLPEADHNALAGLENPEILMQTLTLFLQSSFDHPRNRLRVDLTRQRFLQAGLNTDVYTAQGNSPLAHIWTTLHFGDYLAYYLAAIYGVDPTPVRALEEFKQDLKAQE
jgi:glucose/mannose-6-phosphate isomerase